MRNLLFWVLAFLFVILNGCIPMEDDSNTLSFWTDKEIFEDGFNMIFINDSYLGDLNVDVESPDCSDAGLLRYRMMKSEDLNLSVRNSEGDSIDLGMVNLYSVSTGIKIKPAKDSKIFVNRSLDDVCTLVYLYWK